MWPQRVAVHRLHHCGIEHSLCHRGPIATDDDWCFVDIDCELVEQRRGVAFVVDLAGAALGAISQKCGELLLEPLQLRHRLIKSVCVGVGCAVEYCGANRVGEHRYPRGAELGSVRESKVGDRVLAECATDGIHIPGRCFGGNVLEHLSVVLHAKIDEFLREVDHRLLGSCIIGRGIDAEVSVVVLRTVHSRRGFAGAARIPADDIEPVGEL